MARRARSRIRTLQMQARELGRLRTGTYEKPENAKGRPVRSETWVLTSPAEHYIEAAAAVWGGKPERWQPQGNGPAQWRVITTADALDAVLPPGDPLSQAYELWNRGGCARRCDGFSDDVSGGACYCRATYGEDFGAREDIPQKTRNEDICKVTTRLNVILPALPDLGVWRAETHSYYAASELAATVDTVQGLVGTDALVPIRLRIEQRSRVAGGRRKDFPVIVAELRGPTAGQIVSGDTSGIMLLGRPGEQPRQQIAANGSGPQQIEAPQPTQEAADWHARALAATTVEELRAVWAAANAAGVLDADPRLRAFLEQRGRELSGEAEGEAADPAMGGPEGGQDSAVPLSGSAPTDDTAERQALWMQVMAAAGAAGKGTGEVRDEFAKFADGQLFAEAPIDLCREYTAEVAAAASGGAS